MRLPPEATASGPAVHFTWFDEAPEPMSIARCPASARIFKAYGLERVSNAGEFKNPRFLCPLCGNTCSGKWQPKQDEWQEYSHVRLLWHSTKVAKTYGRVVVNGGLMAK